MAPSDRSLSRRSIFVSLLVVLFLIGFLQWGSLLSSILQTNITSKLNAAPNLHETETESIFKTGLDTLPKDSSIAKDPKDPKDPKDSKTKSKIFQTIQKIPSPNRSVQLQSESVLSPNLGRKEKVFLTDVEDADPNSTEVAEALTSKVDNVSWGAPLSPITVSPVGSEKCQMIPAVGFDGVKYTHCVRPYVDIISRYMRAHGRWNGCDALDSLWDSESLVSDSARKQQAKFVDVGANIGACTAQMILKGVKSVAFEPATPNLFYLTSTMLANKGFADLVEVFPYAASDAVEEKTIFVAGDNAGHAIIGEPLKTWNQQTFQQFKMRSVQLDDALWPDPTAPPPHVKLMKIDTQGYEMNALRGAKRLIEFGCIGVIKLEVNRDMLRVQGSTPEELLNSLDKWGFDIFSEDASTNPPTFSKIDPCHFGKSTQWEYDVLARRRTELEVEWRKRDCETIENVV